MSTDTISGVRSDDPSTESMHSVAARLRSGARRAPRWVALMSLALAMPLVAAPVQAEKAHAAVVATATAYPSVPPPEPVPEERPAIPARGYYWVAGYWNWNGRDWQWV